MRMAMKSQNNRILQHLKKGKPITPIDALNLYGCFRLSARIKDLRDEGHNIKTKPVTKNGKTFASYTMEKLKCPAK
jgi:hypothetical protein